MDVVKLRVKGGPLQPREQGNRNQDGGGVGDSNQLQQGRASMEQNKSLAGIRNQLSGPGGNRHNPDANNVFGADGDGNQQQKRGDGGYGGSGGNSGNHRNVGVDVQSFAEDDWLLEGLEWLTSKEGNQSFNSNIPGKQPYQSIDFFESSTRLDSNTLETVTTERDSSIVGLNSTSINVSLHPAQKEFDQNDACDLFSSQIIIPGSKVGLIIGRRGQTLKQLQKKAGAKMVIIQDDPRQKKDKPLRISGDPQRVERAKQLVFDLLRRYKNPGTQEHLNQMSVSQQEEVSILDEVIDNNINSCRSIESVPQQPRYSSDTSTTRPSSAPESPMALPSSSLPSPVLPSSSLPSPALPSSSLQSPALPLSSLPSPVLPSSSLQSPALPLSSLPSPVLPSSSLPSPALPLSSLQSPVLPSSLLPSSRLPSSSLPNHRTATVYQLKPQFGLSSPRFPSSSLPSPALPLSSSVLPSSSLPSPALPLSSPVLPSSSLPSPASSHLPLEPVLHKEAGEKVHEATWQPIKTCLTEMEAMKFVKTFECGFKYKSENHPRKGTMRYFRCSRIKHRARPQCERKLLLFVPNDGACKISAKGDHTCAAAPMENRAGRQLNTEHHKTIENLVSSGLPAKDIKTTVNWRSSPHLTPEFLKRKEPLLFWIRTSTTSKPNSDS
nr:splicing factor 1 isoform X2 [Aedes albopictus]